mmetsp:Transcript_98636/g.180075  ORF Transcript_98636/g.180075 Transcript_98636/m.180075 type:complete len:83 (-) Transcript_98636:7-255(-)
MAIEDPEAAKRLRGPHSMRIFMAGPPSLHLRHCATKLFAAMALYPDEFHGSREDAPHGGADGRLRRPLSFSHEVGILELNDS